ncbi:MAG: protein-L-isoaspartate(D-aspartate) O-methyltransferase [Gammaproteobacteria bacterium]|nr:protein-L-isoaspartate(D-aspartate) O-methyltransferase [Gammaproteobacteria bacterium]
MLLEIEREVDYTRSMIGRSRLDERVMQAMKEVPRHAFVPSAAQDQAYYNGPLPIGHGQTISQPYIVALMTDLLEPRADHRILEVGTGSGYQAAVLSRLVAQVFTLEVIASLSQQARQRFDTLNYTNIRCRVGDGNAGWPEEAPFDGIIVTAAAPTIPQSLLEQLKPGARLVIPIGQPYYHQDLVLVEKADDGAISANSILGVAFVPLVGQTR